MLYNAELVSTVQQMNWLQVYIHPLLFGAPPIPAPLGRHRAPRWEWPLSSMTSFDEVTLLLCCFLGLHQSIFHFPDTVYVTVSLYMLFPLPAVLTLHLISCSFWSFYMWQIFTYFLSLGAQQFSVKLFLISQGRANSY